MPDLASLQIAVDSRQVKTAEKDLKSFNKESGKTENATKGMTKGFGSMTSALKLLAPALGAAGIGAIAKQMIDVARETQNMRAQLLTMTGSVASAGIEFDRLNQFAKETPYTLKQSIDGFVKLKALGLDPSERAMKSYGNTASAMGKSMQQMIEAVADASTNEFERLKEFGIKAKQQGENVSFTFRGVETTIKKSSENIQQYLMNIGEVDFTGAMANKVNTIDGQLSNLKQSFNDLWRVMGEGLGVTGSVIKSIETLANIVNGATDAVDDFFRALGVNKYSELLIEQARLNETINQYNIALKTNNQFYINSLLPTYELAKERIKGVDIEVRSLGISLGFVKKSQAEVNEELGASDAHYQAWLKHLDDAKTGIEGVNKALEETCERVRKALSCEDKLLFEYDEIAKATYDREQAIKDLDHAMLETTMTDDVYLSSLKKINDEHKTATGQTVELKNQTQGLSQQTVESTGEMSNAWEELNDNIQSEFIDTFVEMLTGAEADFEDFARSIAKMWLNTTLNMAFSPSLSGSMSGSSGNLASTQTGSGSTIMSGTKVEDYLDSMVTGSEKLYDWFTGGSSSGNYVQATSGSYAEAAVFDTVGFEQITAEGVLSQSSVASAEGFGASIGDGFVTGVGSFLGGYTASEVGGWEGVVAGGAVGAGSVAAAGAMGVGAAGAAVGGGMAGATAALAAMGPVGWAALAVAVLAGSGVLAGDSDVTPDINVGGFLGGDRSGGYVNSMGEEENGTFDPVFGYQGIFGTMGVGTQHDAFDSEEAANEFLNAITVQFANMDNSIASALGAEMTDLVVDAIGTMELPELKGEESEDWTETLEEHYFMVFGSAMKKAAEITGNEDWNIWETLAGDMQSIVYVTTEYVKSTGQLKSLYEEMFDIHNKNANIISEQMGNWNAVNGVMEMLGVNLYDVSIAGVNAANSLVDAAGGLVELANLTGYFYNTFYSAQEKVTHNTKLYSDAVTELNEKYDTHISTSTAAYKHWTLEILNNVDANADLKIAMLELAPVTAQVIQAEQAAKAELEAQIVAYEAAIRAIESFNYSLLDLYLQFDNDYAIKKATIDLQMAMDAFGITGDAASYSKEALIEFIEYLHTVELTGEQAILAEERIKKLSASFISLQNASDAVDSTIESLNMLGMTDVERVTHKLNKLFNEVKSFDLGFTPEDLGASGFGFTESLYKLVGQLNPTEAALKEFDLTLKDLGFTADMSVNEIIDFTNSLIDAGVNIDGAIGPIYDWAEGLSNASSSLDGANDAVAEFNTNMKELFYSLKGENSVENTIRQIKEVYKEFDYVGEHTSITRDQLADFIITLDGTDSATLRAESSMAKLSAALINLDSIIEAAVENIDTILINQEMTGLNDRIALEEKRLSLIKEAYEIDGTRYEDAIRANETIIDMLNELKISDLNNQSPLEQMNAAAKLFSDAVAAGDADGATEYGRDYLGFAQNYYASSENYSDIFDNVTSSLEGMITNQTGSSTGATSSSSAASSPLLELLIIQRDALSAQITEDALYKQNEDLINSFNDLALAKDESLLALAKERGVELTPELKAFIGDLSTLNNKTVIDMAVGAVNEVMTSFELAEDYSMEYSEMLLLLSDLGILFKDIVLYDFDIAKSSELTAEVLIGMAADQNWSTDVLAEKLGASGDAVRTYIVEQLGIPLHAIEAWDRQIAADTRSTVNTFKAIGAAEIMATRDQSITDAVVDYGGLFTDNEILHYIGEQSSYGGKGIAEWLSIVASNTFTSASHLALLNADSDYHAPNVGYSQGTAFVPEDQYAFLHKGEAVIPAEYNSQLSNIGVSNNAVQSNDEIIAELRELKEEIRQIKTVNAYGFKESIKQQKRQANSQEEVVNMERLK